MTDTEQRNAAKTFAEHWKGHGYEEGESQIFWLELLQFLIDTGSEHLNVKCRKK